jgi:hypothetical protein
MMNESKPSSAEKVEDASSSKTEDSQLDQSESASDQRIDHSRNTALSKREIMDQLSRERFPWDD